MILPLISLFEPQGSFNENAITDFFQVLVLRIIAEDCPLY